MTVADGGSRMHYTAIIIEDEPIARQRLRALISAVPWLTCVGEVGDGHAAVVMLDALRPDVAFVDIQLPELDGLSVLAQATHRPAVVFTTAFDRYAVAAFALAAVDYLLKPFGTDRFVAAIERVAERLEYRAKPDHHAAAEQPHDHERVSAALEAQATALTRILVRDRGRILPVEVARIERLEADDDYTAVVVDARRYLVDVQISEFERRLDPQQFIRIHRSHIVSLAHVRRIHPAAGGRLEVEMQSGTRIVGSRARSRELLKRVV